MAEQQGNRVEILAAARKNDAFRREVLTGDHKQVVVMTIPPPGRSVRRSSWSSPSVGYHRLRWVACLEMPLECGKAFVEMTELPSTTPNLGALLCDQVAELGRHPLAMAGRAQHRQVADPFQREVQRPEPDYEPQPLSVGRRVIAITVRSLRGRWQEPHRLIEPYRLGRGAGPAGNFADEHDDKPRPSSYWNVNEGPS